jgi:hypothetical protein
MDCQPGRGKRRRAGYFVFSSVIDLAAFGRAIVGPASVPSAVVRIAIRAIGASAAWRASRPSP